MGAIRRFEEIEAWPKARELTRMIDAYSNSGPIGKDFGLRDQIRRASISIMSNIAQGFGRGGNKEFIQRYDHSTDTNKLINGFIRYLSNSKFKGSKFKYHEP